VFVPHPEHAIEGGNDVAAQVYILTVGNKNTLLRGDGKGTQCPEVYLGHPVPGGYKYGDLALQTGGVSRTGTIKYGLESRGTVLARTSSNSKLQTRHLVREGATK
jgi:hypothetical protein